MKTKVGCKGQLSLFMLLGVIVLFIVGILYLVTDSSGNRSVASSSQFVPVQELVTGCMQKVAEDGLGLLLHQNGYIFISQGGPEPDPSLVNEGIIFLNYRGYIVFVAITPLASFPPTPPTYSAIVPLYPSEFFPYLDAAHSTPEFPEGPFGTVNMRPLQEGQSSWAYQLETYLDNKLLDCIHPLDLPSVFPGLVFESGVPESRVIIGLQSVTVDTTYPLAVKSTTKKEEKAFSSFSVDISARLARLYDFVGDRLETESRNFAYDIDSSLNDANGFKINVYYGVVGGADVIEFVDENNYIAGQRVVFWAARLNRVPALRHIQQITLPPGVSTLQASDINPVGYDLDEDSLTFSYFPLLPYTLTSTSATVRVNVSDGEFIDYQDVVVVTS